MKPTEEQMMELCKVWIEHGNPTADFVNYRESIRPKDDAERESWAKLYEARWQETEALKAELAAKHEIITESLDQLNRARGLYTAIVNRIEHFFPDGSRDLDFDVLPGTILGVVKRSADLEAELAALKATIPAPLVFPDPPQGWGGWHNPENLTPELFGITDGWRPCLADEVCDLEVQAWSCGRWVQSAKNITTLYGKWIDGAYTYRTKAPLPAPKPTEEELERVEMDAAFHGHEEPGDRLSFNAGWKAARASKGGGE